MFVLLPLGVMAQAGSVSGKVTDAATGDMLPGVSVRVVGTTRGAVTDLDGNFQVEASATDSLRFSYVGYLTETIAVGNRTTINFDLSPDIETLSEVVVVGYGTTTKKEVTGAVANISDEDITKLNPTRIESAMQGQMAGVNISNATGAPGGAFNIRIRGISSNGSNEPLIIIDGVTGSTAAFNSINPNDIESIDVLKDASAAIYGVRAANGVIFITTKKGKRNSKPSISLDGYYGQQTVENKLDLLNATEYAVLKNQAYAANNQTEPFANTELGEGTDWQNQIFQDAPIQSYNLTISGGSENTNYSFGGSFLDQEGIIGGDKTAFTRYNGRLNFITDIGSDFQIENVLLYTHIKGRSLPTSGIGSVVYNAINASPLDEVRNSDDSFTYLENFSDIINPIAQIANTFNDSKTNKITGKQEIRYNVLEGLTATARIGYNYAVVDDKSFSPLVFYGIGKSQNTAADADLNLLEEVIGGDTLEIPNSVYEGRTIFSDYTAEAFLNYDRTFDGIHSVKGTLGTTFFQEAGNNVSGTGFDVPFNSYEFADLSAIDPTNRLNNSSSFEFMNRLNSYFLRAEYSYRDKYLVSAMVRRDASSKFGPNNRWATFPSVALGWVISDEGFYDFETVNFLKYRISYGGIGKDQIADFAYRTTLGGEAVAVFNDQLTNGIAIGRPANENVGWEQTYMFNTGLDASLFNNRLNLTAEYYVKTTRDLLVNPEPPGILGTFGAGGSAPFVNAGDVRNRGFEFIADYTQEVSRDFSFNATYTITTIDNEVLSVGTGEGTVLPGSSFGIGNPPFATSMREGYPIGAFFGLRTDGVFQTQEEIDNSEVNQPNAQPGDLRFVDVSGDNEINFGENDDLVYLGSSIPKVTMGLNLGINFKGFDVSTMLYSSIGNKLIRNYERQQPLANELAYRLDRWAGAGSTTTDPRVTTGPNNNFEFSDYFVEDGSFLRINNLQVGYTLPEGLSKNLNINRLRVYVSASNLATFTKYKGYNPDFNTGNPLVGSNDTGVYPIARTIMGGFNFNF